MTAGRCATSSTPGRATSCSRRRRRRSSTAARRALDLQIRPRPALVLRPDPFGRFVSAIAWLPRDTFDTRLRERVGGMLARAFAGHLSAFTIAMGDSPLARIHYIIGTEPGRVPPRWTARCWRRDRPGGAQLPRPAGRGAGGRARRGRWRRPRWPAGATPSPPPTARAPPAPQGVADLALAERALAEGKPAAALYRPPGAAGLVLRLASPGGPLPLADALPLFESLDLRAIEEVPHRLMPPPDGRAPVVLHVFTLAPGAPAEPAASRRCWRRLARCWTAGPRRMASTGWCCAPGSTGANAGCCGRCSAG